jgi:hypothetical protein
VPSFFGIKEEGNEKMRENCNGLGEGKCPEGIKRKKTRQEKEKWQMGKSMSRREKGEKGKIGCDRPTHPKRSWRIGIGTTKSSSLPFFTMPSANVAHSLLHLS